VDPTDLPDLLQALIAQARDGEVEWVEFKRNNSRPEDIGEYVSALANSAALHRKDAGYLVWGVGNTTHAVEGTRFLTFALETWLARGTLAG
jgi:predicted HTH transcriptional regulator